MAYLGEEIKKLGFGLMRLPQKSEGVIDVEQTKVMVDKFMEAGFTYFDTAWAYAGSEDAIREALVERYPREKYQLATKMAAWINCKTRDEALAQFKTSLERTKAGYFDFYLLHNLGEHRTKYFDEYGLWDWIREQKEAGLIKHAGFSFHSTPEELEAILTAHPEMEFVQLQINYADWEDKNVQSRLCYEVCVKHNKPVIVMEPVKGGLLASEKGVFAPLLQKAAPDRSLVSWAFRFVHDLPQVKMILSGMSEEAQVQENIALFGGLDPLTEAEGQTIAQAREAIQKAGEIDCTACRYCVNGCPEGIHIPRILAVLNSYKRYGSLERAKAQYGYATRGGAKASQCRRCGRCEGVCPQHLYISGYMQEAARLFEN